MLSEQPQIGEFSSTSALLIPVEFTLKKSSDSSFPCGRAHTHTHNVNVYDVSVCVCLESNHGEPLSEYGNWVIQIYEFCTIQTANKCIQ